MKNLNIENKLRVSILFNIVLTILFLFAGSVALCIYSSYYMIGDSYEFKFDILNKEIQSRNQFYDLYYADIYDDIIDDKDTKINELNEEIESLNSKVNTVINEYESLVDSSVLLSEDNKYLYNTNNELNGTIEELTDRLSKYELYEYAMFDSSGKRNDITYENIILFEELLEGKICDNLNLYLSWIMIESEGYNDDRSPYSTATGLPQFLQGTGRWVWKDLLEKEEPYDHYTTAEIPENSIPMMVAYVDYLCKNNKGNLDRVIDNYRGLHDEPYLRKFDKYLSYSGNSIESIGKEVKDNYNKFKEQNEI